MYNERSRTDSVRTPQYICDWVEDTFGKYYDPCPLIPNWSPTQHKNGLTTEWEDINFVNPPFSKGYLFLKKAYTQATDGKIVIFLCKISLLGRKCFQGMCDIVLFKKQIAFPGYGGRVPRFVCCLLIFHKNNQDKYYFFEKLAGLEFN